MTHSLRTRLLGYTVAIIITVSGGIAFYSTVEIRKDLLAGFQRDRETHARHMAAELAGVLQFHDLRALDGQLRAAHASPDVLYVQLLDVDGRPLHSSSADAGRALFGRQLASGGRWLSVWTPNRLQVGGRDGRLHDQTDQPRGFKSSAGSVAMGDIDGPDVSRGMRGKQAGAEGRGNLENRAGRGVGASLHLPAPSDMDESVAARAQFAGNVKGVLRPKTAVAVSRPADKIWHRPCSLFQPTLICHHLSMLP